MKNRNILIIIFRKIFFKTITVHKNDMHIDSFLDHPIGGENTTKEVIDWAFSGGVGAVAVGVMILGVLFL